MIVPDANLLLYAYDSSSPFHERALGWRQQCLSGSETIGLCAPALFAFVRVGTSVHAFEDPMSVVEASGHVRAWLDRSVTEVVVTQEADFGVALAWLEASGTGGSLTTDAQIAAIAGRCRAVVHTSAA